MKAEKAGLPLDMVIREGLNENLNVELSKT